MSTTRTELEEALDRLIRGERDPEIAKAALEQLDASREERRKRIGTVEEAVKLIREIRDE